MKVLLVFFLATAIVSMATADYKSVMDIHGGLNISNIPPSRIIRGTPASVGEFPYQVRLTMSVVVLELLLTSSCGGSIIAANWVLTAGHCLYLVLPLGVQVPFTSYVIEAGSVVAGDTATPAQGRTAGLGEANAHPGYSSQTLMNDIGLLNIPQAFDFSQSNVQPVALVAYNPAANPDTYVDQFITVSGFGYTANDGPVSPVLLYTKNLKGIAMSVCQSQISDSTLPSTSFAVQDPTPPNSAICSGDSGGPATQVIGGQTRQMGVVSYGSSEGCDTACQGFTNVALFVQWIEQTTGLDL